MYPSLKKDDRRHVFYRDCECFDDRAEAIRRPDGGDHRNGAFAVAAIQHLQQIRLLGLGRQAGARPAALNVDDHQRQFRHDRQADGFALERDARPAGAGDAKAPPKLTPMAAPTAAISSSA